jgi:uncharacterized protein
MSSQGDYEAGDVNIRDDGDDEIVDEYEEGDVNLGPADESADMADDEYVNDLGVGDDEDAEDTEGDDVGNRTEGGTPTSVLQYLAESLATEPEAVVVRTEQRHGTLRLRLHVAPEDMGRVIGRRGRTAQAIRTLIGVAGARDGVQTSVDIVDD